MKRFFILIVLLLSGCLEFSGDFTSTDSDFLPFEDNLEYQAFFCRTTSCENVYLQLFASATKSIHCAFYDLELKDMVSSLIERSNDIDVKLVIDSANYENQFSDSIVVLDEKSLYSHNKFCVLDGTTLVTGSFNPTVNGEEKNDNNIVLLYSDYLVDNYESEFQELWGGVFGGGDRTKFTKINLNGHLIENYFCPEDDCEGAIVDLILGATESVHFMTFSFTSEPIGDALLVSGVPVHGVFEKRGSGSEYSQFGRLRDFGLDVKVDSNGATMHHKVFIIDSSIVVTGSMNPSKSGAHKNDENVLIIHDASIAAEYLEEFKRLFN